MAVGMGEGAKGSTRPWHSDQGVEEESKSGETPTISQALGGQDCERESTGRHRGCESLTCTLHLAGWGSFPGPGPWPRALAAFLCFLEPDAGPGHC